MRDSRWTFSFEDGSTEVFDVWSRCDIPWVVYLLLHELVGNVEFDEMSRSGTSVQRGRFTFNIEVSLDDQTGSRMLLRLGPDRILANIRSIAWLAQSVDASRPGLRSD